MGQVTVASRAHRILKSLSNYFDLTEEHFSLGKFSADLQEKENVVGLYRNSTNSDNGAILITDFGFHLEEAGQWRFISFKEIVGPELPNQKIDVVGFHIRLRNGSSVWVPVSGVKSGKFYDAFEFIRFLDRVIQDMASIENE